jgi:sigma-B regulation protein RsbU (phosphoserine phosphatase)
MSDADNATAVEDLEDLFENAPCGYLSLGADGRIVRVNRTLAKWVGFSPEALRGKRLRDLLNVAGRIFYETHFSPLLRMQGTFNEVALDLVTAQGEILPVLANAAERRSADGQLLFTRVTMFQAAERRRYERDLVIAQETAKAERAIVEQELLKTHVETAITEAALAAQQAEALMREQFIAVLGHDLRNPLASIQAGARFLLRSEKDEKSRSILALMQTSTSRMATLIDNVMDFARGRFGEGIVIQRGTTEPLQAIIAQVVDELRSSWPDRVITTHIDITRSVPLDGPRMGQLISNLLGNALTHGAAEGEVRLQAVTVDGALELWVANGGAPIPERAMALLFQPFSRADNDPSKQGLGLGLYIASEVAKAHGGTLTVHSTYEETRFTLRIPLT